MFPNHHFYVVCLGYRFWWELVECLPFPWDESGRHEEEVQGDQQPSRLVQVPRCGNSRNRQLFQLRYL